MAAGTEAQAIEQTLEAAFEILLETGSGKVVMTNDAMTYLGSKALMLGARGTAAVLKRLQVADESYPADIELIDLAIADYFRKEHKEERLH
jgi:hypothetical protein